jgi:hypothetical protein
MGSPSGAEQTASLAFKMLAADNNADVKAPFILIRYNRAPADVGCQS